VSGKPGTHPALARLGSDIYGDGVGEIEPDPQWDEFPAHSIGDALSG
jgi:hypothetical protein